MEQKKRPLSSHIENGFFSFTMQTWLHVTASQIVENLTLYQNAATECPFSIAFWVIQVVVDSGTEETTIILTHWEWVFLVHHADLTTCDSISDCREFDALSECIERMSFFDRILSHTGRRRQWNRRNDHYPHTLRMGFSRSPCRLDYMWQHLRL